MTLSGLLPFLLAILLGAALSALLTWVLAARRMPASHRVAILGFPQSGKTTLITAVFDFLFRYGAQGGSIVPRGDDTIRRLNDNLRCLELKRPVRPTTDQDLFAYRAEVETRPGFFQRRYKLEIGDFPGEDTVAFAEQYGEWLHDTPYFQWAMAADAFVLVVDVSSILLDPSGEQVAREKSAFRAAWQRLREHHLDGKSNLSEKPLLLVFTKSDLLLMPQSSPDLIRDFASGTKFPDEVFLRPEDFDEKTDHIKQRFADLIAYFERESTQFKVLFLSAFVVVHGERLGIPELSRNILPRPAFLQLRRVMTRESH